MKNTHTFYIIYKLDGDVDVDGLHLLAGYYRFVYVLAQGQVDDGIPNPCQFSADRCNWTECALFCNLGEFQEFFGKLNPSPMRIEREDYIETIHYRGVSVPIFVDDYGQCFYCILDGTTVAFGGFQAEYEDEVKHLIDYELGKKAKQ